MTDPTDPDDDTPDLPVDVVAAVTADEELIAPMNDVLAALTAPTPEDGGAPPLDMERLRQLDKLKAAQRRYKAMAAALGPAIDALEAEAVENVMPHRASDGRWSATVGDKTGYLSTQLWPRRELDESTGEPYATEMLVKALRADQVGFLVAEQVHGQSLASWVREQVDTWSQQHGEDGVRNRRGELVDAFGNALTEEEALDPTAPELALPPNVRKIISVSATMKISFRAR